MSEAPRPRPPSWTDAERLAALDRYRILDTPPEPGFDDLVRLAAGVCRTPIAAVNLVAQGRQWFKSEVGLGVRETTLEVSICARVLLRPGVTVVPDLTGDPCFAGNPLVTGDPHLRFYAGALLETPEGLPLGTLCVLDREARPTGLTPEQVFALDALARQVMTQLELRRALQRQRASEAHQRLILESATGYAIFTLDLAGRITTWNEGARRILGYQEGEALGRETGIIFTPEDREIGAPEAEMRKAGDQGRAEDERWHLRRDGARFWASGLLMPMHEGGAPVGYLKILRDRTRERRAEEALRESEERYRALLESSPDAIYAHQDGHLVFANARAAKLFGAASPDALVGRAAFDLVAPGDLALARARTAALSAPGARAGLAELTFQRLDGTPFPVEADAAAVLIGGRPAVQVVVRDVTERRRAEAHQRLLLRELSHRVKNTLAVVQGIAARSLVDGRTLAEAREVLLRRLRAFADAHGLLTASEWRGAGLRVLVEAELRPYGERVALAGGPVELGPRVALTLSLVLHELATNAAKHGALAVPEGRVEVAWGVETDEGPAAESALWLRWRETGGPPVAAPSRRGFGRTLVEQAVAHELGGSARLEFHPEGASCELRVPAARLTAPA